MLYPATVPMVPDQLCGGPALGELGGGNWMALWELVVAVAPGTLGLGTALLRVFLLGNYSALVCSGVSPAGP